MLSEVVEMLAGVSASDGDIDDHQSLIRESSSCKAASRDAVFVSGFLITRYTAILAFVSADALAVSCPQIMPREAHQSVIAFVSSP
jgi:hypothetical protein